MKIHTDDRRERLPIADAIRGTVWNDLTRRLSFSLLRLSGGLLLA